MRPLDALQADVLRDVVRNEGNTIARHGVSYLPILVSLQARECVRVEWTGPDTMLVESTALGKIALACHVAATAWGLLVGS